MHVSNSQMLAWKSQRFIQGGGGQHEILVGAIEPYIVVGDDPDDNCAFVFHDHVDSLRQLAYPVCNKFVHASVPLQNMLPYMSVKMTFKVAKLHKIAIGSHIPKSELPSYFKNHSCGSCNLYLSIFSIVQSWSAREKNCFRVRRSKPDKNGADSHKVQLPEIPRGKLEDSDRQQPPSIPFDPALTLTNLPPILPDDSLSHRIISDFCASSTPLSVEEAGCTVCGQLMLISQLSKLKAVKNLLSVLTVSNVTRIEWLKSSQPICEFQGPVLDHACDRICDGCQKPLQNGKVPLHVLANGLWLGEVPEELSCLGFVEKLLIARVQVNSCFIHVASSG